MGIFLQDINLKGKTALITGATKGLGRGAALAIAEAGGNVIAIGRNQSELDSLKKEIKRFKVNYSSFNCDVTNYNHLKSFISISSVLGSRPRALISVTISFEDIIFDRVLVL